MIPIPLLSSLIYHLHSYDLLIYLFLLQESHNYLSKSLGILSQKQQAHRHPLIKSHALFLLSHPYLYLTFQATSQENQLSSKDSHTHDLVSPFSLIS